MILPVSPNTIAANYKKLTTETNSRREPTHIKGFNELTQSARILAICVQLFTSSHMFAIAGAHSTMLNSNVLTFAEAQESPCRQPQTPQAGAGTLLALIVGNLLVWLITIAAIAFACFVLPEFVSPLD